MNNQTAKSRTMSPPQAVAHNVNELKHDLLTLLGLQWKLLGADAQQCGRRLRAPVFLIAGAVVLALGAVPVVLLAIAAGLHALGMPLAWALAVAGLAALAVAGGMGYFAWRQFCAATAVLQRSREELRRNMESLKEMFNQNWSLNRGTATPDVDHSN